MVQVENKESEHKDVIEEDKDKEIDEDDIEESIVSVQFDNKSASSLGSRKREREGRTSISKSEFDMLDIDILDEEKERKKQLKQEQRKEEAAAISADLYPYDLVSLESNTLSPFVAFDCTGPYIQIRNLILKQWFANVICALSIL